MKKLLLPLLILIIAIALTACNGEGNSDQSSSPAKPFIGGTRGVSMEFVEGAPPQSVLDAGQTTFAIQTRLTNEGEQDIKTDGELNYLEVSLEGIIPQQFGLPQGADLTRKLEDNLQGGKKFSDGSVNPGTSTILSWDGLTYPSNLQGNDEKSFLVNLCYDYKTQSTTKICLSDDSSSALYDEQSKDICDISAPKTTYNSGAPVHVQNVKQNMAGSNKVSVRFDVVHVGNGAVYKFGEAECDPSIENRANDGKVDVSVSLPESTPASISCGKSWEGDESKDVSGTVTLLGEDSDTEDGGRSSTTVNCVIESNAGGTTIYDETLSIDLKYRYSQNQRKSITIKDIGNSED